MKNTKKKKKNGMVARFGRRKEGGMNWWNTGDF